MAIIDKLQCIQNEVQCLLKPKLVWASSLLLFAQQNLHVLFFWYFWENKCTFSFAAKRSGCYYKISHLLPGLIATECPLFPSLWYISSLQPSLPLSLSLLSPPLSYPLPALFLQPLNQVNTSYSSRGTVQVCVYKMQQTWVDGTVIQLTLATGKIAVYFLSLNPPKGFNVNTM